MIVVSDTTAVTTLLKAGEETLLATEVRKAPAKARIPGTENLGQGETEAIQLAIELHADWLLLDDRRARIAAASLGVRCVALTGLLGSSQAVGSHLFTSSLDGEAGETRRPVSLRKRER